ncbi:LptE family protein [Pontibacter sp. H249]|uniref:LptE family protein n=1 Tax=Pontibacter sp. H249 TaxID=3133420 RepID=UPI0030BDF2DF
MTLRIKTRLWIYALPLLLILCGGCGIYSFSGSTLPPDIQTVTIQNFENSTGEGPANLTQLVTNNFKTFFQRNSNLNIVQRDGDLQLEGQIVSFTYTPAAIQREGVQDIAGLNRLTLGIQVRFTNVKNPDKNFDRLFSISQDFQQGRDVTQITPAEIDALTERLVVDVFNKTVADW